jgi:hypothetical protein
MKHKILEFAVLLKYIIFYVEPDGTMQGIYET